MADPQWLVLGRDAAGRALYEAWHPTRTDNGFPEGSVAWADLDGDEHRDYILAGEAACAAFQASLVGSSRRAIDTMFHARPEGDA